MSIAPPRVVHAPNLSIAWGRVFGLALNTTPRSRSPIVLNISGFSGETPDEDPEVRQALNAALDKHGMNSVDVSAMVIFPYELWLSRGRPAPQPFHRLCVDRLGPRLKARDQRNRLGTYFERMMKFTGVRRDAMHAVDQLSFVIDLLNKPTKWPRHSALQISCFDPAKDHTGQPVRGFPCLQQLGLSHDGDRQIALHAMYPSQYIFDRAYGNYLGLCRLGAYIAHHTKLRFAALNCYIGEPSLGSVGKRDLKQLGELINARVHSR